MTSISRANVWGARAMSGRACLRASPYDLVVIDDLGRAGLVLHGLQGFRLGGRVLPQRQAVGGHHQRALAAEESGGSPARAIRPSA
ncbi:MAG: hypothetical protein ACLTMP_09380 [Eggerthella lenta]